MGSPMDIGDYEKITAQIQRVSDKIDTLMPTLVARNEYEARHASLELRINKVENQFDNLMKTIQELKDEISKGRARDLRLILSMVMSFITGGGLIGLVDFLSSRGHP